jgi:hypothetical protein
MIEQPEPAVDSYRIALGIRGHLLGVADFQRDRRHGHADVVAWGELRFRETSVRLGDGRVVYELAFPGDRCRSAREIHLLASSVIKDESPTAP